MEFFPIDQTIECYSNVGAFGIDGGLSTLIGQSIVTDKLCFMIIGDLAFFYDMNSLSIRNIKIMLESYLLIIMEELNLNCMAKIKLSKTNL